MSKEQKFEKGLKVATFKGEIDQTPTEKDKNKKKILNFNYDRVVFPWSRTGKDTNDAEVTGAVPTMSEAEAYCHKLGFQAEFKVVVGEDGTVRPDNDATIVGFLIDGLNRYLNLSARTKAENTPESAKAAAVALFAKKMNMSIGDAEKMLFGEAK